MKNRPVALFALAALALATTVHGNSPGEYTLYVLNCPISIQIEKGIPWNASQLADIVSSTLGFTTRFGEHTWKNLLMSDPFELPEAVVILEIPGKKNPGFNLKMIDHHHLIMDESLEEVYTTIERNMKERFAEKQYSLLRNAITPEEFRKSNVFHQLRFKPRPSIDNVNTDIERFKLLYDEIYNINQLSEAIKEKSELKNNVPDVHWFQMQGVKASLSAVKSNEATDSQKQLKEEADSERKLYDAIADLIHAYNLIYNDVLFFAVTKYEKPTRRHKREVDDVEMSLNVAEPVSSDYPVIFNLLLWFTVIMVFSLIAICVSIAQMDPGRDSIIYRMTSNRMKKEN